MIGLVRADAGGEYPQYDLDIERSVLGSCLIYPELLRTLEVTTSDFFGEAHRSLWREMQYLEAETGQVDQVHLRARLIEIGKLAFVGGDDYLMDLTEGRIPVPNPPVDLLKRYAKRRVLHELGRRLAAAGAVDDDAAAETALRDAHEALEARSKRGTKPEALAELWRPIGEWCALTAPPPPHDWLLRCPDPETNGETSIGVLPLGKCGMIYGDGGSGKSWANLQLAMAVATGRRWFDFFDVINTGNVLIAMGEEDRKELHRRLYAIGLAMRLTPEQQRLASERIVALPLAGKLTALIESDRGVAVETAMFRELRARLDAGNDWRLVILDPQSRFAGADTETDNAAATRFVQVVESLMEAPGNPTVLVSHHTRKPPSDGARKGGASAANARGASALIAGFRWAAELERVGDGAARFSVTKSNYAPWGAPVDLVRDAALGGYLRVATREELRRSAEAGTERESARVVALADRAATWLAEHPGAPKSMIAAGLRVRDRDAALAVDHLVRTGRAVLISRYGYSLAPNEAAE